MPLDFDVAEVASAAQVAIIRGRAPRLSHADMSTPQQVGCTTGRTKLVCVPTRTERWPSRAAGACGGAPSGGALAPRCSEADAPLMVLMQYSVAHHQRSNSGAAPTTNSPVQQRCRHTRAHHQQSTGDADAPAPTSSDADARQRSSSDADALAPTANARAATPTHLRPPPTVQQRRRHPPRVILPRYGVDDKSTRPTTPRR